MLVRAPIPCSKPLKVRLAVSACVQVVKYCLRTEEHHGWMMKVYQQLAQLPTPTSKAKIGKVSQKSSSCAAPRPNAGLVSTAAELQLVACGGSTSCPRGSSPHGGASFTQQAMHQRELRVEPQHLSPATTKGFTHELFSVTPLPERADHDGHGGVSGSSRVMDSFYPAYADTTPPGRSAGVRLPPPPKPDPKHIPAYTSHRTARLRAQGLDPALVTRMGLACSEEILAGCIARMAGGGHVGGPMAALAASLRGLDGPALGQENTTASASSFSSKHRGSEISDPEMYYKQLERSRGLVQRARDGQSFIASKTQQDGAVEKEVHGRATDGQRQQEEPTAPQNASAEAHLGQKYPEEAETLSDAQVQQRCNTTALCVTATAGKEQNGDPEYVNHKQDKACDVALEASKKRKADCLTEASDEMSQPTTLTNSARY